MQIMYAILYARIIYLIYIYFQVLARAMQIDTEPYRSTRFVFGTVYRILRSVFGKNWLKNEKTEGTEIN